MKNEIRLPLEISKLRAKDKFLVEGIFERYPKWRQYAYMVRVRDEFDPIIDVPSPNRPDLELIIWSDNEAGPTFDFASYHVHIHDLTGISEEMNLVVFWETLAQLLAGELVVVHADVSEGYSCALCEKLDPLCETGKVFSWI